LTAPSPIAPPSRGRRLQRVLVQVIGFAAGLASLGWCVSLALKPENKHQFEKLAHSPRHLLAAMLGLSLLTVLINGLLFWIGLLPARRLKVSDVLATNALCTFLGYLPLKAGAIARVLIHNRRDGVPLLTIGAWFTSMGATMGVAFGPPILALIALHTIDGVWVGAVLASELLGAMCLVLFARAFRGQSGLDRLSRLGGPLRRLFRSNAWAKLHPGFDMLASPPAVGASLVLRLCDAAVHSARFLVAAEILGVDLPLSQAFPVSLTFFLIGIVSPSGMAGLREGAATGLAGFLLEKAGADEDSFTSFAAVSLLVTATEAVVFLTAGALGVAWLRPDRLLRLRAGPEPATSPAPDAGSEPPPT
jgi:hypothetical protein